MQTIYIFIEKIAFEVVQIKCLAMHITNKNNNNIIDIFTVENVQNIFMEPDIYLMIFGIPIYLCDL